MKRHTIEQKEEYRVHVDTMETKANIVQQTGWSLGVDVVTVEREAAVEVAIALLEFAGWQPMETAPKDGTRVLSYSKYRDRQPAVYVKAHTLEVSENAPFDWGCCCDKCIERGEEHTWSPEGWYTITYSWDEEYHYEWAPDLLGWLPIPKTEGEK